MRFVKTQMKIAINEVSKTSTTAYDLLAKIEPAQRRTKFKNLLEAYGAKPQAKK